VDLSITNTSTTPLSDSDFNNSSSDTIPLRLSKQITGDEEFMIELELNKGSNMRCYTYDEGVSNLPSDLVVQDNTLKRGLTSVEALEKLVSVTNKILAEHKKPALTRK
ncbi:8824_t:CDS:2, partial [Dentiscutata erythropus]